MKLTAFSHFVPGDSFLASFPGAYYEIEVTNSTQSHLNYACCGVIANPWTSEKSVNRVTRHHGKTFLELLSGASPDALEYGQLALATDAEKVSCQEYWRRGSCSESLKDYWNDLTTSGAFVNRACETGVEAPLQSDHGLLAAHFHLAPGEKHRVRFVLTWYVPNRSYTRDPQPEGKLSRNGIKTKKQWRNYYARLMPSAFSFANRLLGSYAETRRRVFLFRKTLYSSTIPQYSLEGAGANLAVLVSPACLRLENGTFWGWEGDGAGMCQHVWNYAQAMALLFPDLERSIRRSHARYGFDESGRWQSRLSLPLGINAHDEPGAHASVDGTCGEIMKIYREWKICGDKQWLSNLWPRVKQALEYAWSEQNPDHWDPEQSGVISGRQHHTLGSALFGPSGWLNSHYLGALKAAAEMATAFKDHELADKYQQLCERGRKWTEEHLFNGEYFIQEVDLNRQQLLAPYLQLGETLDANPCWDPEHRQLKDQLAEGCCIDSHLGQWYASLYGIGEILDPEQIRKTLAAIFRYNCKKPPRKPANSKRPLVNHDEGRVIMCAWPKGKKRPKHPLPCHDEAMTGFEWAYATHLALQGETQRAELVAKAIRTRYDGTQRNPWNETERGSHCARAMASFAMLQAHSGFSYDMTIGEIGFRPVVSGDCCYFWSLGTVWGEYQRTGKRQYIRFRLGGTTLKAIRLAGFKRVFLNTAEVKGTFEGDCWRPEKELRLRGSKMGMSGDCLRFE